MNAGINKPSDLRSKIGCVITLMFGGISDSEMDVIVCIVKYVINNELFITLETGNQLRSECKLTGSGFSTALSRLEKKNIIRRNGKTVILHPAFNKINEMDKLIINFK